MKKIITLVIVFVLLFSILAINNIKNVSAAGAIENNILTDYAYEIRLVKYEKSGDTPTDVGEPVLVYHPDLFRDIENHVISGGSIPATGEQIAAGEGSFTHLPCTGSGCTTHQQGQYGEPDPGLHVTQEDGSYSFTLDISVCTPYTGVTEEEKDAHYGEQCNEYSTRKFDLMSGAKRASYPGSAIQNKSKYHRLIEDSNIGSDQSYLKGLMLDYISSSENIQYYFNIYISDMDLHKYYVEAIPVQRVLGTSESDLTFVSNYFVTYRDYTYIDAGTYILWHDREVCDCAECDDNCQYTYCPSSCTSCDDSCNTTSTSGPTCVTSCSGTTGSSCTYAGVADLGVYCTTSTTVNHTETADGDTKTVWDGTALAGSRFRYNIYGKQYTGKSYLKTAHEIESEFGITTYLDRVSNTCGDEDNKHCILDEDTEACTGVYDYYIGPNQEHALVGRSSANPYRLNTDGGTGNCTLTSGSATRGRKFVYIIAQYRCMDACKHICDTSQNSCLRSDDYLKCSETYCESIIDYDMNGNPRKRKKNCIIGSCQYRYGRNPVNQSIAKDDPNLQSYDGCANSSVDGIVAAQGTTSEKIFDSKCNKVQDSAGHYVPTQEVKGTYVTACTGDLVTDFDGDDSNDETFDQRTYINKVCKEVVNFEFTDTSVLKLSAGLGFTYPIIQGGNEFCTYFINKEQWMFDYATIPARNKEYQRDRMLLILQNFNDEVSKIDPDNSGMSAGTIALSEAGDLDGEGMTGFQGDGYDFSKTTVKVSDKEYSVGELNPDPVDKTIYVENKTTGDELVATVGLQTVANESVKKIADGSYSTIAVNRYTSQSGGEITYTLKKVCIRTDGTADVYDAPGNNECHTAKDDRGNAQIIHGSSTHYTNFNITPDVDNPIGTTATVISKDGGDQYYKANESCTYKVSQSDRSCVIKIEDAGTKLGYHKYIADEVKAKVVHNIPSADITSIIINDNGDELAVDTTDNSAMIKNHNSRSVETHSVTGIITLKDGSTIECPDTLDLLIKQPPCDISCSLDPVEGDTSGKLYEMKYVNATHYYTFTTFHETPSFAILSANNSNPYPYMKPITHSVNSESTILNIRLDKPLEEGEYLFGYVTTNDPSCNFYCYETYKTKDWTDCYERFKPIETDDIREYCKTTWTKDKNGFKDEEDCFVKCSTACPADNSNYDVVDRYCDGYASYGYPEKENCMNECYKPGGDPADGSYIFRTINVEDPFPNSRESEAPYEKGNRIVGQNWRELSKYITSDDEDQTSVTGVNWNNQKVEYIIDMTAEDIRMIRENTESSGYGQTNKRKVYAKLDRITDSSGSVKEYRSSFIHDSDFRSLFKPTHGVGSSYIEAVFPKE